MFEKNRNICKHFVKISKIAKKLFMIFQEKLRKSSQVFNWYLKKYLCNIFYNFQKITKNFMNFQKNYEKLKIMIYQKKN